MQGDIIGAEDQFIRNIYKKHIKTEFLPAKCKTKKPC